MPRILAILLFLAIMRTGFGQELRQVKVFTQAELQQFARMARYPTKYLRLATYYADSSVSLIYHKGTTSRQHLRTVRYYSFFYNGSPKSRGQRHWLRFGLRRTKEWNEAGQLAELHRRNKWGSTSYTYVSRRFIYDHNRLVRKEVKKAETGCFSERVIKRKFITFTDHGRVVTFPGHSSLGNDSISTQQ